MSKRFLMCYVLVSCLLAAFCFYWLVQFDNKYTWAGIPGYQGVTDLSGMKADGLQFLVHGWEVYEDRLLTPEQIRDEALIPDRYIYIGQYGGFEFGRSDGEPSGCATYRMRLELPEKIQGYRLELPEIYSAYRLWINGSPVRTAGIPEAAGYRPETRISSVQFSEAGTVELVFQVANYTTFYSGLVYPPAFGNPDAVQEMQDIRVILHTAACFFSLFLGGLCLLIAWLEKQAGRLSVYVLLCMCYAVYISYPLVHTLGFGGTSWYVIEKAALYGMLLMLVILAGDIGRIPKKLRTILFAYGAAVLILVSGYPWLPMRWNIEVMHIYSKLLNNWQWLVAIYLFYVCVVVVKRQERQESTLLAGAVFYGFALLVNAAIPLLEPVYTGWPMEISGLVLVINIGVILINKSRESNQLKMAAIRQRQMAEQTLESQRQHSELLTEYLRRTGKRNHEVKKELALLRHYFEHQEYERLGKHLELLHQQEAGIGMPLFTINPLINSIMILHYRKAAEAGIRTEYNLLNLPPVLFVKDQDISSLLSNLLDNAIEGCMRLEAEDLRWLKTSMEAREGYLSIVVENTAPDPGSGAGAGQYKTQKEDALFHGFGMEIIAGIIEAYEGMRQVSWKEGVFIHQIVLFAKHE